MNKLLKSALVAAMCVASFGCNSQVDHNFDHSACTIYTNAMAKAESKIVDEYGQYYNNLQGYEINAAANKFKKHHTDLINEAHNHKQLTYRERAVMLRSVELLHMDMFLAYKQANMLYELRLDRKGYDYALKARDREMHAVEKVAYKACRDWE